MFKALDGSYGEVENRNGVADFIRRSGSACNNLSSIKILAGKMTFIWSSSTLFKIATEKQIRYIPSPRRRESLEMRFGLILRWFALSGNCPFASERISTQNSYYSTIELSSSMRDAPNSYFDNRD